ncbi:MAG TPA: HAMP domain-containing protein, partial [Vulgatibacter sp.]
MERTDGAVSAGRWKRVLRVGGGPGRPRRAPAEELVSLRDALRAAAHGDFAVRLPADGYGAGPMAEAAQAFNVLQQRNEALVDELDRLRRAVSTERRTDGRVSLGAAAGGWAVARDSVNGILDSLTIPMARASRVLERLAVGDLSRAQSVHVDERPAQSEVRRLEESTEALVSQLWTLSNGVSGV